MILKIEQLYIIKMKSVILYKIFCPQTYYLLSEYSCEDISQIILNYLINFRTPVTYKSTHIIIRNNDIELDELSKDIPIIMNTNGIDFIYSSHLTTHDLQYHEHPDNSLTTTLKYYYYLIYYSDIYEAQLKMCQNIMIRGDNCERNLGYRKRKNIADNLVYKFMLDKSEKFIDLINIIGFKNKNYKWCNTEDIYYVNFDNFTKKYMDNRSKFLFRDNLAEYSKWCRQIRNEYPYVIDYCHG